MENNFEQDEFPDRPKILFVGFPESSHTHSWIDLIADAEFNVRLFALPSSNPPNDWPVKTYLTVPGTTRVNSSNRKYIFPPPDNSISALSSIGYSALQHNSINSKPWLTKMLANGINLLDTIDRYKHPKSAEAALAHVITEWKPDIIHTLGFDSASYFYLRTRKEYNLDGYGRWVAQARGGPDLALQRFSPEFKDLIEEVLQTCHHFIADNQPNYDYALSAGVTKEKILNPGMGIVSGAGGIDLQNLRNKWSLLPSQRERLIVWPKAYETYTAKAMPVFEAILKVWEKIQPCRIEMLWMVQPDIKIWYEKLFPDQIKGSCSIFGRLSRDETLTRMSKARIMLAPSLSDGIPNTMMEAMALGTTPIVSPLETIVPVVNNNENVVFARNLYPDDIAEALVRLMNNDELVDHLAKNNLSLIKEIADRDQVKQRALIFYNAVASKAPTVRM